jgi:hypothetical protein
MGLTWLPAKFARFMTHILRKYLNKTVAVYFNNIIIFSRNPEEHEKHVREVMQTMMDAGLMMSIQKCMFDKTEVQYLGLVFTQDG